MDRPKLILFDIDGFVCDSSVRLKKYISLKALANNDYSGYTLYSQTTEGDLAIKSGVSLVRRYFYSFPKLRYMWVTSRDELGRNLTLKWLQENVSKDIKNEDLLMKPSRIPGDKTPFDPIEYKRSVVKKLQNDYDIVLAGDDDIKICRMYNAEGITSVHLMVPDVDCLTPIGNKQGSDDFDENYHHATRDNKKSGLFGGIGKIVKDKFFGEK